MADGNKQLDVLRGLPAETEWLEFKEAKNSFAIDDLGRYVSALANEANFLQRDAGWLVFGVKDRVDPSTGLRPVVGSRMAATAAELNEIKRQITSQTSPSLCLDDPLEVQHPDCPEGTRVLLWRITPAPQGMPVAWKGHYYGRAGETLCGLSLNKMDAIRAQSALHDWSAALVSDDWALLDPAALTKARELYARRHVSHPHLLERMHSQSDTEWLHGLRLAVHGRLTRAALVLLGKPEATAHLGGPTPRISWVLLNHKGDIQSHEHFDVPLLLGMDGLVARLRIIQVSLLPPRQTAPLNLPNYDDWVIREALHNCIAHQDYRLGGRIRVTESPDTLVFFNLGAFLPGSVEKLLAARQPEQRYRNACLANAMVELDLMETLNRGVRDMFRIQRERFFPLPDFEFGEQPASVGVTLYGQVLDKGYVDALMTHTDLSLAEAVLLDQIQKGHQPPANQLQRLRAKGLVEGRSPKLRISAQLAVAIGQEVAYVNQKGPAAQDYKDAVCRLLAMAPQPRAKIDELLNPKLMVWIAAAPERKNYIKDLLADMARQGTIRNIGKPTRGAVWALAAPMSANQSA